MASSFKTLREYLYQPEKTFVVPNYQRGYKWSVKESSTQPSHVEKLCSDLIEACSNKQIEYFLQGITVSDPGEGRIILIDGQQRTTTLYLLLWCFGHDLIKDVNLVYDIRERSKDFINDFHKNDFNPGEPIENEHNQDIYYFKRAVKQIKQKIKENNLHDKAVGFVDYILNNVKILYIVIDETKAVKTFTMMNGSKANMLPEELVKAEMLRLVSKPDTEKRDVSTSVDENLVELREIIAKDWEMNALRSRYAREWDKWLYWWNRADVKAYFSVSNPMGILLEYHLKREQGESDEGFTFQTFKGVLFGKHEKKSQKKEVKEQFKKLRDLQKSFEDIFNTPKIHNYLKLALICAEGKEDKFNIIQYFLKNKNNEMTLCDYAKWRLVGASHLQIFKSSDKTKEDATKEFKAQESFLQLSAPIVYTVHNVLALKQLLRLNVEEDNKLNGGKGRKFDFSIYNEQSLEHVYPKSKVYHKEDDVFMSGAGTKIEEDVTQTVGWLNRDDFKGIGSEHCIGNLVLLYKNENSQFSNSSFEEKKRIYFSSNLDASFRSRNLLHSISVFAKSEWGVRQILDNQKDFLDKFKKDYDLREGNNE